MKNAHISGSVKEKIKNYNKIIELSNINKSEPHTPKQQIINETEDEDIIMKFNEKRRRKNVNNNSFNKDNAFTTVSHQLREEFSLGRLGKIEWAKEHSSANKPMHKINEFTKSTKFCNCCNLPCETPGIIERFPCSENTENFYVCGKAVPLYFYFIRYCIITLIIVACVISIPITIINKNNLNNIEDYCYNIKNGNIFINNEKRNTTTFDICSKYLERNFSQFTNFFSWLSKASSNNILDYKELLGDNKNDTIFINYSIIGFLCMISLFIINIFFIILFNARIKAEKSDNIQPSDYTVLITDLQKMAKEFKEKNIENSSAYEHFGQEDLTGGVSDYEYDNMNYLKTQIGQFTKFLIDNLFYNLKTKQKLNIFNLNLCFKLNEFMILKKRQEECKYKIFQIKNNPYQIEKNNSNNYIKEDRRYYTSFFTSIGLDWLYCTTDEGIPLKDINQEKQFYEDKLDSLVKYAKIKKFSGCIFATFNSVKDKEEFYNYFPHSFIGNFYYYIKHYLFCCFIVKKNKKFVERGKINVYLAPEPEDVIWENMEFTLFQRLFRIIILYLFSFLLIAFAFIIVYQLNAYQESIETKSWSELLKYISSFSITIIISILNVLLKYVMNVFTKMEKQKAMTYYYLSYSIKLTIFTFMTSAIVPFFSDYIRHQNVYNNENLITNMFFIFLTNSFISPIIWAINISLIIKKIRIFLIERRQSPNSMHFKTQKELNELYEYPDMDIASKYSYIFMTLLMTMFYLPIFPLGVAISLLGFVLAYFIEKYNFTHGYKRPEMLNEKLGEFYFNFFICIMVSYSLGNFFFINGLFDKDSWPLVNITFFGILSILPFTNPITYYFQKSKKFNINSKPIKDIYFKFFNDYQRQNPFTKKEGMYFYINELKKRGYVTNFIYDILIKNVEKINVMEIYYNSSLNPTLKEAQRNLIKMNKSAKKFSMDDLKKSITRIFREKVKNANKQNEENTNFQKSSNNDKNVGENNNNKYNKILRHESDNSLNSIMSQDSAESPSSSYGSSNSSLLDSSIDSVDETKENKTLDQRKKKNQHIVNNKKKYCLTQAFNNDSFLINQYKDPLLLSIGQGIKNIAYMDNKDYKRFKKEIKHSKRASKKFEKIVEEKVINLSINEIWGKNDKKENEKNENKKIEEKEINLQINEILENNQEKQ